MYRTVVMIEICEDVVVVVVVVVIVEDGDNDEIYIHFFRTNISTPPTTASLTSPRSRSI